MRCREQRKIAFFSSYLADEIPSHKLACLMTYTKWCIAKIVTFVLFLIVGDNNKMLQDIQIMTFYLNHVTVFYPLSTMLLTLR